MTTTPKQGLAPHQARWSEPASRKPERHTNGISTLTFSLNPRPPSTPSDDKPPAKHRLIPRFLSPQIQDDSRVRLVQPAPQVRQGFPFLPCLLPPRRSDPQVRDEHLPSVLP